MTYPRYILHRIGKVFGINLKVLRSQHINNEKHLLRQGEAELGSLIWQEVDAIGELRHAHRSLCELDGNYRKISKQLLTSREQLVGMDRLDDRIQGLNKEVARLISERSHLEKQMSEFHREIGKHILLHAAQDSDCRKAASCQRRLVEVLNALRRSIELNRRLNGTRSH